MLFKVKDFVQYCTDSPHFILCLIVILAKLTGSIEKWQKLPKSIAKSITRYVHKSGEHTSFKFNFESNLETINSSQTRLTLVYWCRCVNICVRKMEDENGWPWPTWAGWLLLGMVWGDIGQPPSTSVSQPHPYHCMTHHCSSHHMIISEYTRLCQFIKSLKC